ncbi:MAG: ABC transporter permease subunit [Clostridia bacterium]
MSLPLFKNTLKRNYLVALVILAILIMYLSIINTMYDPAQQDSFKNMLDLLPKAMVSAMGFDNIGSDLTSFLVHYYYGFIIFMFPMIYFIIIANRLVAEHVDKGSMSFYLSTPITRVKIVLTQAIYLIFSIVVIHTIIAILGVLISEAMFPGLLDIAVFIKINIGAAFLTIALSSFSFFFSCLFNQTTKSLAFGAGVPLMFFVFNMLSNVSDKYSIISKLTIYSIFDIEKIMQGELSIFLVILAFSIISLVFYMGGIYVFSKKDLPI